MEETMENESVAILQDLIRIPSENFGDRGEERDVALYIQANLAEVGIEAELIESAPGRTNVAARIKGASDRPGLVLHGHIDVVPADAKDWSIDPFSGAIQDGAIWGRGAVDMKDMDAMMLATVRSWARTGYQPPRDIALVFFADEEAGGTYGSRWMVENRPDVFAGCNEAISEVGGFSITLENKARLYLIETAQKGIHWMRLVAEGRAGHGSMVHPDNAVTAVAEAVARIGNYEWPLRRTKSVDELLERVAEVLGVEYDPNDPEPLVARLGPVARLVGATLRNTANPTRLNAGYKENVIPQSASAVIDGRFLPGFEDELNETIRTLAGEKVRVETITSDIALEAAFEGAMVENMVNSILAEDPEGIPVPYTLSGGTDNKALSQLGIKGYGFSPLKLPADLDFTALFHGIDERVPVESLKFGARVLDRFLRNV
ncbi:MAG: M20/M25/M40 family metallo-hydrolase [Actinobacteria bacterium]|nr:M20/M25/M40 family metallo-hydrolase [Actinomycetota bacterium]MSY51202.1 M20/M25/M40 family metallo-hydrolase [Actinomycetota bacterium]MSY87011.1 M20/M25/M40 family metallo-hydrolase [Actinomycetota bacterium]